MKMDLTTDGAAWGYVYFVQDRHTRLIKVGFSRNPDVRRRQISSSVGHPCGLLAAVPGNRWLERRAHATLAASLDHGEWFRPTPAVRAFTRYARDVEASGDPSPRWYEPPAYHPYVPPPVSADGFWQGWEGF